ncbi:MAG: hypothetical protein WAR77_01045 [Saprospiraceae bacterium]|nr:hypothetical protein [Saprospiraceae bacterium]MBK9222157.1 hypothetical protein [Saprospiraceae bacterium]MBK9727927.1 hypothetical protein [Saprospiraceae bacterium]
MSNKIAIVFINMFIMSLVGLNAGFSQTGAVPPLKDVPESVKILKTEMDLIGEQILQIQQSGGTVEELLQDKFDLFKAVHEILQLNNPGTTTFQAIASNSNRKSLLLDDEAYQLLVDGQWDENLAELIRLLTN